MYRGHINSIPSGKQFGFIRDGKGVEYFFHREDFNGHWEDLVHDVHLGKSQVTVEFDIGDSRKGPRAANVRRVGHPNGD